MRTSYTIASNDASGDSEFWTGTRFDTDWKLAARWTNLWAASLALSAVAQRFSARSLFLSKWVRVPAQCEDK